MYCGIVMYFSKENKVQLCVGLYKDERNSSNVFQYFVQSNKINEIQHYKTLSLTANETGKTQEIYSDEMEDLIDIELPGTHTYLPHLKGHPEYLKPIFRMSRNRSGVDLVIGIPTIKRLNASYLDDTLSSLFANLSPLDASQCLIIVFIAEPWDMNYLKEMTLDLQLKYPVELSTGLLEIMAPSFKYYPDLDALPLTLNDDKERVKWRTKQNLDYAFLMLHAYRRGQYYIQLEDDIVTRPGYFSTIMQATAKHSNWTLIRCSALGFIGKVLKTSDLPLVVEFLFMFHGNKPCDWLLENLLTTKVCTKDMLPKECQKAVNNISIDIKPPLFQHIGLKSSLKGKIQKLKEKAFKLPVVKRNSFLSVKRDVSGGPNPPAKYITSSIPQFENFSIDAVYTGVSGFWGYTPMYGDTIDIAYEPPLKIHSYKIETGCKEHPLDISPATTSIWVLSDSFNSNSTMVDSFYQLGNFNDKGLAQGLISANFSSIKIFRIRFNENMKTWVWINQISIRAAAT
ncbi:alpha-1 3-mannosyl-glycoprotein 4-beta-N-acetylglucosaminyltransferase A [Biomphalaria glabrata]